MQRWIAALAACALLAGCTKVGTSSDSASGGRHSWTIAGTLRIAVQNPPNTLNGLLASNTTESMINRLIFDPLVSVDATGKQQVPILAAEVPTLENGGISKDGLTLTYKLRKNVLWHDGVPFTSKDVKFSWSSIVSGKNNVITTNGYDLVKAVDTPDDYTVIFHMKKAFSPVVNTLFGESDDPFEVVPEHILGKLPDMNQVAFNSAPIGTGPFKFKLWNRGDHIELVANDKYFLGAPKLQRILIKFIPDENTELSQLQTHEVDWQFEASPQQYRTLKTLTDIVNILQPKNDYERIQINTQHAPFDDVRVRQAVAYAIDREKLVHDLTFGSAALADQDHPPFMWAYDSAVTHYPHDLAKAKALMLQAGWTPGADGMLAKNGEPLNVLLVTNVSNATRRTGVVQVQAMLHQLGMTVQIKEFPGALLYAQMNAKGILQNGKFDLAWTGWVAGIDPDQSSIFYCKAQPPRGNNETHYCNLEMDAAEDSALSHFDMASRKAAYAHIETMLTRDLPELPIWWPRQIQPVNPDFKGFTPNPVTESWNAYQWEI
jgi:peptide/nickel transport system substrate-binding protein